MNTTIAVNFPKVAALAAFDGFAGDIVYNHHA